MAGGTPGRGKHGALREAAPRQGAGVADRACQDFQRRGALYDPSSWPDCVRARLAGAQGQFPGNQSAVFAALDGVSPVVGEHSSGPLFPPWLDPDPFFGGARGLFYRGSRAQQTSQPVRRRATLHGERRVLRVAAHADDARVRGSQRLGRGSGRYDRTAVRAFQQPGGEGAFCLARIHRAREHVEAAGSERAATGRRRGCRNRAGVVACVALSPLVAVRARAARRGSGDGRGRAVPGVRHAGAPGSDPPRRDWLCLHQRTRLCREDDVPAARRGRAQASRRSGPRRSRGTVYLAPFRIRRAARLWSYRQQTRPPRRARSRADARPPRRERPYGGFHHRGPRCAVHAGSR
jgi:hypothetical protein